MSTTPGTTDVELLCPECGSAELEMRGEQRVYAPLDDGEVNGWNSGEVEWDTDHDGNDLIYCVQCDCEFGRPGAAPDDEPASDEEGEAA